jgi:NAD(P)-dependent dehydrogenase (short-subunit alcohol dehydrogenase family)
MGAVGRPLVNAFADAGATLALCVRRPEDVAEAERLVEERGAVAFTVVCDVRYEEDVVRAVHRIVHRVGRIDVAVNAASMTGPEVAIADYPVESWRDVIATNLTGAYLVCREVLPWMLRQQSGSIINATCPLDANRPDNPGAQCVGAWAVEGLTRILATEVKGTGVRVNLVEVAPSTPPEPISEEGTDWTQAFLWLAGDDAANTSGGRFCAKDFSKTRQNIQGRAQE